MIQGKINVIKPKRLSDVDHYAVEKVRYPKDKLSPWRESKLVFKVIGITHCSCQHFMSAYYRQVSLNPS